MMNRNLKLGMEERLNVLNSLLLEQGAEFTLVYTRVWKNNQNLEGYTMKSQDNSCSPTVYYDSEWFDKDDESVIRFLSNIYMKNSIDFDASKLMDRDYILSKIKPRLVSDKNLDDLKERCIAHVEYLDMLVLFYIPVDDFEDAMASIQVTEGLLKSVNISLEDAYVTSIKNLESEVEVKTMVEVLCGDMGIPSDTMGIDEFPMWVGTVKNKLQGAAALLCKSVLYKLEDKIGGKVAILPSSVHEFIAVAYESEEQFNVYRSMVKEVNSTQVAPVDKLTDSVYFVDDGTLKIAG